VTDQEVEAKVLDIISNHLKADKATLTRDKNFVTDLNADSLEIVELLMDFEDHFKAKIPDDEAEKIKTVGDAIDTIKRKVHA